MADPITNVIQRDAERLEQARVALHTAFKQWDPFGPQAAAQEQAFNLLRAAAEKAEQQLNQTFLKAPSEERFRYLKESILAISR